VVRQLARDAPGWHVLVKVVHVLRETVAAAFVALAMIQAAESLVAATELVREACCGEEEEVDSPPHP
jgi:hypothetical protein